MGLGSTEVLTLTPCKISGIVSDLLLVFAFRQTHVAQFDKEVLARPPGYFSVSSFVRGSLGVCLLAASANRASINEHPVNLKL
jgi:hypothetical protein